MLVHKRLEPREVIMGEGGAEVPIIRINNSHYIKRVCHSVHTTLDMHGMCKGIRVW